MSGHVEWCPATANLTVIRPHKSLVCSTVYVCVCVCVVCVHYVTTLPSHIHIVYKLICAHDADSKQRCEIVFTGTEN